eukprot:TRINITY_DN980_c0_g1_i4.p3 TRINITY_DN980_c0_g1~~TRINITY_DN980_c0_g1_i4.p3  ORF type:complete len:246 (+),score=53.87 TRINITY_DN980_c0_g1_i4:1752-2489(+)
MSLAVTGDDSYLESKREKRAKTERLYEHHEDHLSERVPVPLVALQPEATPAMCAYCFDVIACRLEGRTRPPLPPFTKGISCPFFVTWEKQGNGRAEDFKLRGCIGTLSPQPLTALADYACSSAFDDRRFSPIAQCELRHLKCSVSLLVDYEDAEDVHDWEVSEHGIIITFKDTRGSQYSATYLPEVARDQGWTKAEALESLIRKSGYAGPVTTTLLQRATLTRYRSRKCSLHHAVYAAMERPSAR